MQSPNSSLRVEGNRSSRFSTQPFAGGHDAGGGLAEYPSQTAVSVLIRKVVAKIAGVTTQHISGYMSLEADLGINGTKMLDLETELLEELASQFKLHVAQGILGQAQTFSDIQNLVYRELFADWN